MKPFSDKFAVPVLPDSEEMKRLRKQEACEHVHYSCICGQCGKTLGSEIHFSTTPIIDEREIMLD